MVDGVALGARPVSRGEVARIVTAAEQRLGVGGSEVTAGEWALQRLRQRVDAWGLDGGVALIDEAGLDYTELRSPARAIPPNGVGGIDAFVNPLAAGRGGRRIEHGSNVALETEHSLALGPIALAVRPRFEALRADGESSVSYRGDVAEVYARLVVNKFALEVGREHLVWGFGRHAGLAISTNAPGLDMVRLTTETPVTLPWIFSALGPTTAQVFVADLGPEQNFPHAKLAGWRFTVQPWHSLEFSVQTLDHVGGSGAPPATFGERVADFIPLIDVLFQGEKDFQFSNKLSGAGVRWRVPDSRGLTVSYELLLDDFDVRRVKSSVWEDGGHMLALNLPRVTNDGRTSLDVEVHHTGLRFYEHSQFVSGLTSERWLIGDPLGPNGNAGYAHIGWQQSRESRFALEAGWESRSGDRYATKSDAPDDAGFRFELVQDFPEETRARVGASWESTGIAPLTQLLVEFAVERASNFAFQADANRTNVLGRIGLTRYF